VEYCCFNAEAFSSFDFTVNFQYGRHVLCACTSDRERSARTSEASTSRKPKPVLVLKAMSDERQSRLTFVGVVFSCPTKSADKIGEPCHAADIFVCYFVRYQLAQQPNADRKIILASLFFCI